MDVWAEKTFLKAAGVILLVFLLASCTPRQVIVVSDPYIDALYSGAWGPSSGWFAFKSRLAGHKISNFAVDQETPISAVLESAGTAEIIVLSPWNAASLEGIPPVEGRFIVAGAAPMNNLNTRTTYITLDRSAAISEIASLSAGIVSETGVNALAIVNAATAAGKQEKQLLINDFQSALTGSGQSGELIVRDMADEKGGQLPGDFKELSASSSVLLLLAGPINLIALTESGDSGVPVITENLGPSTAWKDRIIVSIEDNPKAMNKLLMSQLNSETSEEQQNYPARLVKGVLYGSPGR